MNYLLFLINVLRLEASHPAFIIRSFIFSLIFLLVSSILLNIQNLITFTTIDYPLIPKITILLSFMVGFPKTISSIDLALLIIIAILFGINVELVVRKLSFLKKAGSTKLTFGAGIISIAVSGCASCGLSVLSFIGLGGAIAILPFGGIELYILAIAIMIASLFYNLRTLVKVCKIER